MQDESKLGLKKGEKPEVSVNQDKLGETVQAPEQEEKIIDHRATIRELSKNATVMEFSTNDLVQKKDY